MHRVHGLTYLLLLFQQLQCNFKVSFALLPAAVEKPSRQLFPFQEEGVNRLIQTKRILLADEMGLGKTIQCIAAINKIGDRDFSILITCPKSLLAVWEDELQTWLSLPFHIQIVSSTKPFPPISKGSITLINYDICHKFRKELHTNYDVLICDEAHYLKSPTSKRTIAVLGDGKKAAKNYTGIQSNYLWLLTGTPVLNRPVELFPLLHAISYTDFKSYKTFCNRYCNPKKVFYNKRYTTDVSGASNLLELSERLKCYMMRRYKVDVLTQLPPKFRSCVCLIGGSRAAKFERERIREVLDETKNSKISFGSTAADCLESFGSEASELLSYLNEMTYHDLTYDYKTLMGALTTVRKETALSKLNPSIELLENIILSEKVVVFAYHRELILKLAEHFGDKRSVCVLGGMDGDSRFEAVRRFQNDEDVRMFIGSIRTAGVGLTLTAASRVIFLELDWSPGVMSQAEDRCHRVGQRHSVQIQYYVFKDTIEERIAKSLLYKESNINQILPEKLSGLQSGYTFDFGEHEGLRLEDVPRTYVNFLLKNEVWRKRSKLWYALFAKGLVFEDPQASTHKRKKDNSNNTEKSKREKNIPTYPQDLTLNEVEYVFDFGTYNGRKWNEVPQNYRDWVIREGVWKKRPILKTALIKGGLHK